MPFALLLACALVSYATGAHAQDFPAKTVRIIVPLAAGGLADILARTVAQQMTTSSGQNVVVENRPGGAGAIGGEAAARAPADN
jgi:tripartite-type tricarboxylate transporter receptor subunit TctC